MSSFSGLVPIPDVGALFYWYFAPLRPAPEAPLILWLQGGPGASSMVGNLFELGPITVDEGGVLRRRAATETWATDFPVVFVDSPVGVGFSYANDGSGYARNETAVASALASFLQQFKAMHPELPKRLIIAAESYGGHYAPALSTFLLEHPGPFQLDGVMVGDGLTDPATQVLQKPNSAFGFGLIDEKQLQEAQNYAQQAHDFAMDGNWAAAKARRGMMEDVVINASHINPYDVRTTEDYKWQDDRLFSFFGRDDIKDLLHVPQDRIFDNGERVKECLNDDVMQSYKGHVETLLKAGIRVLLYQGQFDWKDGVLPSEAWIRTMQWDGIPGYLEAPREVWRRDIDGHIAGYWRSFRNLEQVVVLGAGHLVPMNQPLSAADMLARFAGRPAQQSARLELGDEVVLFF